MLCHAVPWYGSNINGVKNGQKHIEWKTQSEEDFEMPIIWLNANDDCCTLISRWLWPVPISLYCVYCSTHHPMHFIQYMRLPLIWASAHRAHIQRQPRNFSSRSDCLCVCVARFFYLSHSLSLAHFFQFKYIKITAIFYTYSVFILILQNKWILICLVFGALLRLVICLCIARNDQIQDSPKLWRKKVDVCLFLCMCKTTNWICCRTNCKTFSDCALRICL